MSEKHQKIFMRILIITAAVWALGFLADLTLPWIMDMLGDNRGGHGGGWTLCGTPLCILTVAVSYVVLRIASRKGR